ncbi:MAG: MobF family relaxase [bacterium]
MLSVATYSREDARKYFEYEKEQNYLGENLEGVYGGLANKHAGEVVFSISGEHVRLQDKKRFADWLPDRPPVRKDEPAVAAYDLTFTAPKSFSILAELTDDPVLKQKLFAIHDFAVSEAMKHIEKNLISARLSYRDADGKKKYESVCVDKAEYAIFRQHTSRRGDPNVHGHGLLANRVYVKGKEYAIDGRDFYKLHIPCGTYYRTVLANELMNKNIGIKIRNYKDLLFEIDGIPQEAIELFSKQSKRLLEKYEELKKEHPDLPDARLKEMAELATRPKKDLSKSLEQIREKWKAEYPEAVSFVERKARDATTEETKTAVLEAAKRLTEQNSFFTDLDFRNAIRQHLIYNGFKFNDAYIEEGVKDAIKHKEILRLSTVGNMTYTTKEIRTAEKKIEKYAELTRGKFESIMSTAEAVSAVKEWEDKNFKLTGDQRNALNAILTSKDGLIVIQGDAGTGKTTVFKALKEITENKGIEFDGLSTSGNAAEELELKGKIKAGTIDGFLLEKAGIKEVKKNDKKMYIVDESSMNATLKTAGVTDNASKESARVVAVGDTKQLPSVQAGGTFGRMQKSKSVTFIELKETIRQKESPELKKIVETIAAGKVQKGLKMLDEKGKIHEIGNKDELFKKMTDMYVNGDIGNFMLAALNKDRIMLNDMARYKLQTAGKIGKEDLKMTVRESRNVNGYEKTQVWNYETGDIIVRGLHNYEVKNIDIENKILTAYDKEKDKEISMTARKDNEIYRESEKAFSLGDKIMFLKNGHKFGVDAKNGQAGIIESITKIDQDNYRIDVKKKDKTVSFETANYNYFTHGYCLTSPKSQGQDTNKALIFSDRTTKEETYVNISRAKLNAEIFTLDKETLIKTSKRSKKQIDSLTQQGREYGKEERIKKIMEQETEPEKKVKRKGFLLDPELDEFAGSLYKITGAKKEKAPKKEFEPAAGIKPGREKGDLDIS